MEDDQYKVFVYAFLFAAAMTVLSVILMVVQILLSLQ